MCAAGHAAPPPQALAHGSAPSVQALVACQGIPFLRDLIDVEAQVRRQKQIQKAKGGDLKAREEKRSNRNNI